MNIEHDTKWGNWNVNNWETGGTREESQKSRQCPPELIPGHNKTPTGNALTPRRKGLYCTYLFGAFKNIQAGGAKKETSRSLECANWQYRCVCDKEWFRQERGSSLPAARGSWIQVTWLKASSLTEIQVRGHPPYSPDLSPCVDAIFWSPKKPLRGKRFASDDDVKQ